MSRAKRHLFVLMIVFAVLTLLGVGLNKLVVKANAGKMPVDLGLDMSIVQVDALTSVDGTLFNDKWIVMAETSRLSFLGDIIKIPLFISGLSCIFSIGDLLIIIGLTGCLLAYIKQTFHEEKG